MDTYKTYERLRDRKGLKDSHIAKSAQIPASTFTDWKNGKSKPKREKMQKIANVMGVPVEYLETGDARYLVNAMDEKDRITTFEFQLIENFRKSDELTQQMILRLLGMEKEECSNSLKEA